MQAISRAYQIEAEEVLVLAQSTKAGLSEQEAARRLADGGKNKLETARRTSLPRRFFAQLVDPMVLVLVAAAVLSALLSEWTDSAIIIAVIAVNAALAMIQEGRAEHAAEALSTLTAPRTVVRRDGGLKPADATELVVGDIVRVEAGDIVPADLRLLSSFMLAVDEASLTGESQAAEKSAAALNHDAPLAERSCMLFMGSPVLTGRGEGVVVAVGMDTQMGRIAGLLADNQSPMTPLQRRLAELSRVLSIAVLAISALVFLLTITRGAETLIDSFLLAVSLAVAAVPEGLVVVVTLVLSLGMIIMSRKNAIIRKLSAVETLGAVQVICSDKTGTLTENRMRVVKTYGHKHLLAEAAALCSSVQVGAGQALLGDPTEIALVNYAREEGEEREEISRRYPLVAEIPFDSSRKLMSTMHQYHGVYRQYTKGAFEAVLDISTHYIDESGKVQRLLAAKKSEIETSAREMAGDALRVMAAGYREEKSLHSQSPLPREENLTLIGLYGLIDPPRREAAEAVAEAAKAGVTTVMVSGDNIATASAIARELGILGRGHSAISGNELEAMDERQLMRALPHIRVFARVRPEDKLRIIRAWQKQGCVTAMTGDGVNDAPALAAADIGVGMGKNGAEVSRRAAALVLADDNYATIISAVREGRRIYENIRRAVQFLLASNLAEVLALVVASLLGLRLFLPIHLLWINLITDCLPAVALGLEQAAPEAMRQAPRGSRESLFSQGMGYAVIRQGSYIALLTLVSFLLGCQVSSSVATTMAFITLSAAELFHAWNMRSRTRSIFSLPTSNYRLTLAIVCSFALNLLLLYLPAAGALFSLVPLSPIQLFYASLLSFAIVPLVEIEKLVLKK